MTVNVHVPMKIFTQAALSERETIMAAYLEHICTDRKVKKENQDDKHSLLHGTSILCTPHKNMKYC